jgi:type II secretory pathway component PulF
MVKLRQRIRFYQQLAVLLRAGLPVRASIDRLRERITNPALAVLSGKIAAGDRLGESFAAAGFEPFETNLIVAGESSGQLEVILEHLAQFWQRELEFRQALIAPLIYPIVVLHFAVILGSAVELFDTPPTTAAIHLGLRLVTMWAAGLFLFFVARFTWSSPAMKRFWLLVPIVGGALQAAFAYRWITSLRMEFNAGISFYRAVGDAWRSSSFPGCERLAIEGEEAMRAGSSLSTLMAGWRQLPRAWADFAATGEISGGFETAFKNLEAEAAREWTLAQQRMSEWVPKILYFVVLIIAAVQVGRVMYQVEVAPMVNLEREIDNANGGN